MKATKHSYSTWRKSTWWQSLQRNVKTIWLVAYIRRQGRCLGCFRDLVRGVVVKGYCLELLDIAENHGLDRLQTAFIESAQCIKFQDLKNDNICQKISFSNYRKMVEGMFENYERKLAGK